MSFALFLDPLARLVERTSRRIVFECRGERLEYEECEAGLRTALDLLATGTVTERALVREALVDGSRGAERLYTVLVDLADRGGLRRGVMLDATSGTLLASARYRLETTATPRDVPLRLSSLAYIRPNGSHLCVASPDSPRTVVLHDWRASALLARLAETLDPRDLAAEVGPLALSPESARRCLDLLWAAGLLSTKEALAEGAVATWEFHDLLFHTRTRLGRHDAPYGATFPGRGKVEAPPVFGPARAVSSVDLYRPDIDALMRSDLPFSRILESRRSQRRHGEDAINLRTLGEFLYRTARARGVRRVEDYQISDRVYPSGGALYELEVYAAIDRCRGADRGLYHYCPHTHRLELVAAADERLDRLLGGAAQAGRCERPQVLLIFSARFARVTWKYCSIAYATTLKNVGVLFQTMYLVATAMGLAGCALGGGDSDLFAATAGTDYYKETSVGEFMLGSAAG
jgi:oxazoline/thiazoline dehydrogenase